MVHLGNDKNKILWGPNSANSFSTEALWDSFKTRRENVAWHGLVWFKKNVLRYAFTLWLAIKDKLTTRDKLVK